MLAAPMALVLVFQYLPMAGIIMAFQDYLPNQGFYVFGSEFVGFANFARLFADAEVWRVMRNTVIIAVLKIILGTVFPITVAVLLNEVGKLWFKRGVQTAIFLPYFISWVIMSGVLMRLFSSDSGIVTVLFRNIGITIPKYFEDASAFPSLVIFSNLWKDSGYGVVVYLAAITTIDPTLYEAAKIDGAGHFKRCVHITLPGMLPVIILLTVLNMGNVLNAGFEQVFNLYNEMVYSTGDILDTYIYRKAFGQAHDYSFATAVGLLKSVISLVFISAAYIIAQKKYDYRIF